MMFIREMINTTILYHILDIDEFIYIVISILHLYQLLNVSNLSLKIGKRILPDYRIRKQDILFETSSSLYYFLHHFALI